ncbi:hypothetical protein [Niveispirillum sp. KHB5.9]|uniref:hypothetical protein n=1 Tax=Niveispirillum sp. KHB5.9 TaxID=3400269 RepID=UPI003A896F68
MGTITIKGGRFTNNGRAGIGIVGEVGGTNIHIEDVELDGNGLDGILIEDAPLIENDNKKESSSLGGAAKWVGDNIGSAMISGVVGKILG